MGRLPKVTVVATLGLFAALPSAALAEWRVQHGLDIETASESVLLIGRLDERATLYAKCLPRIDSPAELSVHVFDGLDEPLAAPTFAGVTISTDLGRSWSSRGEHERVPGFLVTQWLDGSTIRSVLDDLIGARAEIRVDFISPISYGSWTVSAAGSTAAGRAFLESCAVRLPPEVDETTPASAPAIPPPARAPVLPGASG